MKRALASLRRPGVRHLPIREPCLRPWSPRRPHLPPLNLMSPSRLVSPRVAAPGELRVWFELDMILCLLQSCMELPMQTFSQPLSKVTRKCPRWRRPSTTATDISRFRYHHCSD